MNRTGTRGRTFAVQVVVRSVRRVIGSAVRAEKVSKVDRVRVWAGWLEEGRYRSVREVAEAVGLSAGFVSRVLRGFP